MQAELAVGVGDVSRAGIVQHARAFAHPAWVRELPYLPHAEGTGDLPRADSLLAIDNANVVLAACKPADDGEGLTLRLYNTSGEAQSAAMELGVPVGRWCRTDLREQWDDAAAQPVEDQALALRFAPHQIQTLRIR
jgi:mannosylglycerate hydrolase